MNIPCNKNIENREGIKYNQFSPQILCLLVSVLIIYWHCSQVSNARAQLAKKENLHQKELSITFRRNVRNMTRGLRVDPVRGSAQGTKGGPGRKFYHYFVVTYS